jgi:hypothetical protein
VFYQDLPFYNQTTAKSQFENKKDRALKTLFYPPNEDVIKPKYILKSIA